MLTNNTAIFINIGTYLDNTVIFKLRAFIFIFWKLVFYKML
jgi:hypothetical protein